MINLKNQGIKFDKIKEKKKMYATVFDGDNFRTIQDDFFYTKSEFFQAISENFPNLKILNIDTYQELIDKYSI